MLQANLTIILSVALRYRRYKYAVSFSAHKYSAMKLARCLIGSQAAPLFASYDILKETYSRRGGGTRYILGWVGGVARKDTLLIQSDNIDKLFKTKIPENHIATGRALIREYPPEHFELYICATLFPTGLNVGSIQMNFFTTLSIKSSFHLLWFKVARVLVTNDYSSVTEKTRRR